MAVSNAWSTMHFENPYVHMIFAKEPFVGRATRYKGSGAVNMTRMLALIGTLITLLAISVNGFSSEVEAKKSTIYRVPTTGTIMDVIYLPEFDEWWVKCREGKGISVYSYDKRSGHWGKARFLPKTTQEKAAGAEKVEKTEEQKAPARLPGGGAMPADKEKERSDSPGGEQVTPEDKKPAQKPGAKEKKKKWWDPLKLLEGKKPDPAQIKDLP